MVYLDNTTETQRVFIPRTNIEASAYHPSTGGTEKYYAGTNIEITPQNVINVTGMTEAISAATEGFVTSGDVHTQIEYETANFVTSGDVESQITAATDGLASEQYVNNAVSGKADTSAVTEAITSATSGLASTQYVNNSVSGKVDTSAMTAYTPTSGFATINNQSITNGGNITIEGGQDYIPKITTLPADPEDGAVYNYNGVLVKYVNGPGNWGEWFGGENANSRPTGAPCTSSYLYYGVLPNSVDGVLLCVLKYISTYRYCTFNLSNNTIDVYDNQELTGTPVASVSKNAQSETMIPTGIPYFGVSWNEHQVQFRKISEYGVIPKANLINTSASTAHYELVNRPEHSNFPFGPSSAYTSNGDYSPAPDYTVRFDKDGNVVAPGKQLTSAEISINNTSTSSYYRLTLLSKGSSTPGSIFAPTTSGDTGSLCVSQGNAAPVWKSIAQALGVDFWTGSQQDYDDMTSHSPTTIYIIVPSNS